MKHVKCVSAHPQDLAGGRVLARGEIAQIDDTDPHNAALIEGGALLEVEQESKSRRRGASNEEDS